jgi:O-antigen/teichoic acid export membrane protein
MNTASTIARNTTIMFISSIIELVVTFVTSILVTRGLGTELYGLYAYTIWLIGLATIITNLGLGEMARRFIPEAIGRNNNREVAGFIRISILYRVIIAIIVCLAILVSSGYWARQSGDTSNQLIFVVIAFSILPLTVQASLGAIFTGFQRFDYSLYLGLIVYPLRIALVAVFMALGFGVLELVILNVATVCLSIFAGIIFLRRLVPLKDLLSPSLLTSDEKKQAIRYAITVAGIIIVGYLVSQQVEIFFISLYCSVEDVGFYTLAFRIGMAIGLFPASLAYVLLPIFAARFGSGEMEQLKRVYVASSRYLMMAAVPVAVGGIILADSLITIIYGVDYQPVVTLFRIICLPIIMTGLVGICDSVIRGINRPGFIFVTRSILAVLNICLSLWLVPVYGILGAVIANSVPLVLNLPLYSLFIFKKLGVGWPMKDTLKITLASLIMGGAVYGLHSQLNAVLSLVLCIPLGIIIYFITMFFFKIIGESDLVILKRSQESLPPALRKFYMFFLGFIERIIIGTKSSKIP